MKNKIINILFCLILLIPIISTTAAANQPPTAPTIDGPPNGNAGVQYTYGFCSEDPDGDNVTIIVNWGEGEGDVSYGPFPSGICATATHAWSKKGTYIIKAKASDGQAESAWATLSVTMPCSYYIPTLSLWEHLFERFPNAFPILRFLLQKVG
jgi:hypothetical protein